MEHMKHQLLLLNQLKMVWKVNNTTRVHYSHSPDCSVYLDVWTSYVVLCVLWFHFCMLWMPSKFKGTPSVNISSFPSFFTFLPLLRVIMKFHNWIVLNSCTPGQNMTLKFASKSTSLLGVACRSSRVSSAACGLVRLAAYEWKVSTSSLDLLKTLIWQREWVPICAPMTKDRGALELSI